METNSVAPLIAIAIPVLAAALIYFTRARPNVREACSVAAAALQLVVVLWMVGPILDGETLHFTISSFIPQVAIALRVDALGLLFAATASFGWLLTTIYSIGYLRSLGSSSQTRYYAAFAIALAATVGIAFSANLVTLYLFYEGLTFITYPLVTHAQTEEAFAAGKRYLQYHLGTSVAFLLPAIIVTFALSDTFDFRSGGVFAADTDSTGLIIAYVLFVAGASKAAIMPLHVWLPGAMVAPVPVSALLHAVAVVNAGVFLMLRVILDVFGVALIDDLGLGIATAVFVSFTVVLATVYAYRVDSLKAVLAYSTISHLSLMILAVALLDRQAMTGGIMHLVNHSLAKITLFFCAGSILVATGKTKISELGGIGRQLPWTMGAFAVGALSIVGLPPTAGFVTKYYIAIGIIDAKYVPFLLVLFLSTLVSAAYYLRILRAAFFETSSAPDVAGRPPGVESSGAAAGGSVDHVPAEREGVALRSSGLHRFIVAPLVVTAALSLAIGIYPSFVLELVEAALP
jgi:multicomponent Na+:H+ antiporter subunit D